METDRTFQLILGSFTAALISSRCISQTLSPDHHILIIAANPHPPLVKSDLLYIFLHLFLLCTCLLASLVFSTIFLSCFPPHSCSLLTLLTCISCSWEAKWMHKDISPTLKQLHGIHSFYRVTLPSSKSRMLLNYYLSLCWKKQKLWNNGCYVFVSYIGLFQRFMWFTTAQKVVMNGYRWTCCWRKKTTLPSNLFCWKALWLVAHSSNQCDFHRRAGFKNIGPGQLELLKLLTIFH